MANKHNVTFSQQHERALGVMLAAYNARQAASIPPGPPLTADQYFEMLSQTLLGLESNGSSWWITASN